MRAFILTIVAALLALTSPFAATASANSISSIDIEVQIQPDGSALVTDHRRFEATEGTEHFISLGELGESEITDFKVTDHGLPMQDVGKWDVDASLEEKAGKYGINKTSDGLELCWGIGQLGYRDFTAHYRITNFVRNLSDGPQAIYWQFLNRDMDPIEQASIRVTNAVGLTYSQENTKIWGFGYRGDTAITPDALTMNGSNLTSSSYVVLLAILPQGTVNAAASYPYDAAGIEARAKEGSDWDSDSDSDGGFASGLLEDGMQWIIAVVIPFIFQSIFWIVGIIFFIFVIRNNRKARGDRAGVSLGFKGSRGADIYREIPPGHFSQYVSLVDVEPSNWMAAWMLEWIRKEYLIPQPYTAGWIFKREEDGFRISDTLNPAEMPPREREFWDQVVAAAGENRLLERSELMKYYSSNRNNYFAWRDRVRIDSTRFLEGNGLIHEALVGLIFKRKEYAMTPEGELLRDRIEGLEKFMKQYSLLAERQPIEVHLWDDYLVWAAFLGIAEEVEEQFNIVDPTYAETSSFHGVTMSTISGFKTSAEAGYTPPTSSGSSGSSGGGGSSSSGGGGGGASGGGSGGGTR